jgi:hypothetical protein
MLAGAHRLTAAQREAAQSQDITLAHISPTLYFPSASEELASRNALHDSVGVLVKELAASDLASLGAKLDTANQTSIALQRHAAYLKVQTLENHQNQEVKAAQLPLKRTNPF